MKKFLSIVIYGIPFFRTHHIRRYFLNGWHTFTRKGICIHQLKHTAEMVALTSMRSRRKQENIGNGIA